MSEKPINFSTEMVQAILDNRKTQTRRVVKYNFQAVYKMACYHGKWQEPFRDEIPEDILEWYARDKAKPKYQPGDILWVRETWCKYHELKDDLVTPIEGTEQFYYHADGENPTPYNTFLVQRDGYDEYCDHPKWRPSTNMPREAARIFLKVTGVRVERLQEIIPNDCYAEGIIFVPIGEKWAEDEWAIAKYAHLWNSLYAKDGYGWDMNPWVWVYAFERVV